MLLRRLAPGAAAAVWKLAPESPYWAVGKGRQQLAKDAIRRLADGKPDRDLEDVEPVVDAYKQGSYLELFHHELRRVTWLQSAVNFFFTWGYWALASWMPILLTLSVTTLSVTLGCAT